MTQDPEKRPFPLDALRFLSMCWAENPPFAQCYKQVDPYDEVGLCERHRLEILPAVA